MRIAIQRKVTKIGKRLFAPLLAHSLFPNIASEHLGHFDVEQMRRVQRLGR